MNLDKLRQEMVERQLKPRGIVDPNVLKAMRTIPRHLFVPKHLREAAYSDGPLSIGKGQTISQPFMVAFMTQCLKLTGDERVLEIGTGSGYQTAVLAESAKTVYTVERISVLSEQAAQRLRALGYDNCVFRVGDGTEGWPEMAPFDAIMVTAGAPTIPPPLMDQLDVGGRFVIPVGSEFHQTLYEGTRTPKGIQKRAVTDCVFVPLIGQYGWPP